VVLSVLKVSRMKLPSFKEEENMNNKIFGPQLLVQVAHSLIPPLETKYFRNRFICPGAPSNGNQA